MSFVILNYGNLTWTTGVMSGGDEVTGLGGNAAVVSYNTVVIRSAKTMARNTEMSTRCLWFINSINIQQSGQLYHTSTLVISKQGNHVFRLQFLLTNPIVQHLRHSGVDVKSKYLGLKLETHVLRSWFLVRNVRVIINEIFVLYIMVTIINKTLDGQGRARREAARRRKSECKINLGPR